MVKRSTKAGAPDGEAASTRQSGSQGMVVEEVPLVEVVPDPANARVHDESNLEAIKGSLARFGQQKPIVVDHAGVIRAGNGTYAAAKALGWPTIKVVRTDLSPVDATAYSIADNRTSDLSEFDDHALAQLLRDLRAEDALDGVGFAAAEIDELLAELEAGEGSLVEDPGAGEPPEEPVTRPGDLWVLGKHRLLCGDSASTEDLDRLLAGVAIHLVNMDPPYNVKVEPRSNNAIAAGLSSFSASHHQKLDLARHPSKAKPTGKLRPKDRPLTNDYVSDEEFARLLRAWFKNAARVLLPGRAAYIWGGYANVANYPPALAEAGLYFSQAIIWNKLHPVLTRKDYMGAHEWCQPGETEVLTPDGNVPISSLRDGDRVVSFRRNDSMLTSRRGSLAVRRAERRYAGPLLRVVAGGRESYCTPGHIWSVRIARPARDMWCVYLMRRGAWWRIGKSKLITTCGFGVKHRLKTEDGDAVWLLSVHDSNLEATIQEQVAQVRYGIPTTTWNETYVSRRTLADVSRLYSELDPAQLERNAMRALADHGRDPLYPFIDRDHVRGKVGARVSFSARACNLIPGVMLVPVPSGEVAREVPWTLVEQVRAESFDGLVHSLAVPGLEHYVADGIVTHNCFYTWREGAAHQFFGPANATDLWEIKKVNPQSMIHLTEKPVELAERAILYSSRAGENVLDLFGGSGSTLIACERTGRKAFLMEIDAPYSDVIIERWQKATSKEAVLEGSGHTFAQVAVERGGAA